MGIKDWQFHPIAAGVSEMSRKDKCPITKKPFNCQDCKVPDMSDDGECPIMRADEYIEETMGILRKVVENEIKSS